MILGFIAAKMLAHDLVHFPAAVSLAVILAILAVTAAVSLRRGLHVASSTDRRNL